MHIKENWSVCSLIVEMITDIMTCKGQQNRLVHDFLITLRPKLKALLELV